MKTVKNALKFFFYAGCGVLLGYFAICPPWENPNVWAETTINGQITSHTPGSIIDESEFISEYLVNTGSNDMGIDGSSTSVTFSYTPPSGKLFLLGRILIYLESGGNFDSVKFANVTALSNGVSIRLNGTEISNWKDNIDITITMYDILPGEALSKTTRAISGRWTLTKAGGMASDGMRIDPDNGGVAFVIQDDLSSASFYFRAKVQGILIDL